MYHFRSHAFVVDGDAEVVVTATGAATRLASIASLTSETPEPTTPLTKELRRVVRSIAVFAVGVGATFFVGFDGEWDVADDAVEQRALVEDALANDVLRA